MTLWVLPSTANRALEFEWTGETHFHIEDMTFAPTRVLKRTHGQTLAGKTDYPPGLHPTRASTGAQASGDPHEDLSRTGAPGAHAPEVRVRIHDTTLDVAHDRQPHGENWTKDGLPWIRHHSLERYDFYIPVTEPGGPDVHLLDDKRFTLLHYQDGTTSERLGNWRGRYDTPPTSDKPWTGATTFTEKTWSAATRLHYN